MTGSALHSPPARKASKVGSEKGSLLPQLAFVYLTWERSQERLTYRDSEPAPASATPGDRVAVNVDQGEP